MDRQLYVRTQTNRPQQGRTDESGPTDASNQDD